MANWPSTLPAPLLAGFGHQPNDPVVRTQMDQGRMRMRRRFSTAPNHVSVSWMFTDLQMDIFRAWWVYQIASGAGSFTVNIQFGSQKQSVTARFLNAYKDTRQEKHWRVEATLELEGETIMTSNQLQPYL